MLRSNSFNISLPGIVCCFHSQTTFMQQTELQFAICMDVAAATHSKASAKDCGLNASICPACLDFTLAAALVCRSLPQDGVWGEIIYPYIYV